MKKTIVKVLVISLMLCTLIACGGSKKTIAVQQTAAPAQTTTQTAAPAQTATKAETVAAPVQEVKKLEYAEGTVLRMATGYNSKKTGLTFDADTAKDGIEHAGKIYRAGELKPTLVGVQNVLGKKD